MSKELPNCIKCLNLQRSRAPSPDSEGVVLPGDELLLECEYDTSARWVKFLISGTELLFRC